MAPSTLTPTPSGLSRSTATYFSSSLPLSSLPSWSLDHSCTTFGVQQAKHPRSMRLIDDEPDRDEEDHIRGIKRNRKAMETSSSSSSSSSISSSKRRCYPMMLPITLPAKVFREPTTFRLLNPSSLKASSRDRSDNKNEQRHRENVDSNRDHRSNPNKNEFSLLSSSSSSSPSSSESYCPLESGFDDNDKAVPAPPKFRRRSTIRDPFDLASSIEEFKDCL